MDLTKSAVSAEYVPCLKNNADKEGRKGNHLHKDVGGDWQSKASYAFGASPVKVHISQDLQV